MREFNLQQFYQDKFYEQALIDKIEEESSIVELIENLRPNANTFRQIFTLVDQLSKIESSDISSVLAQADEITNHSKLNRKEKLSKLKKFLEKKRYPMRFKIEEKLDAQIDQAYKKYAVRLRTPKELEGDTLTIEFQIKGRKDLDKKKEKLQSFFDSSEVQSVLSILQGEE